MADTTNSNKFAGKEFIVSIQDPGDSTGETWIQIAGLRATGGNMSDTFFDVTSKDNMPWAQTITGGIRKMTISLGGVFSDAASLAYLSWRVWGAPNGGIIMPFKLSSSDGDMFEGPFAIKSLDRSGPHTAEETYTMSLESASDITYTAPLPTLVSCTPDGWAHGTATPVILKGTKFMLGAIVKIAGVTQDAPVTVTDAQTISIEIPIQAGAGAIMMTVTNPDGQSTAPLSITLT